jgi:hypothetical protein
VVATDRTTKLGEVGELTGQSGTNLQKPGNLVAPCDIGNLRNVTFNDGFDIGAIPVVTPTFSATLDGVGVATHCHYLE